MNGNFELLLTVTT